MKRRIKKGLGILLAIWVECLIKDCKNSDFKEVNAGWVARQLQVTLSHLSRTFLLLRGISLHEFIDREKIKRAKILLKRYPKIKIKKVAETLGYSSVSYFAKVFMKYNDNLSPLCYRLISYLKLDWPRSGKQETAQTRPGVTPKSPETTPTMPEVTFPSPETTFPMPEVTPTVPEMTFPMPEITPPSPETTFPVPEVTPTVPEMTFPMPEVTPTVPEMTFPMPEITPTSPEMTPTMPGITPTRSKVIPIY